jgi:hypothetical protein
MYPTTYTILRASMRAPESAVMKVSRRRERIERFHPERVEMPLVHGDHHRFARFGHSSNAQEIGNPLGAKSLFCELTYIAGSVSLACRFPVMRRPVGIIDILTILVFVS